MLDRVITATLSFQLILDSYSLLDQNQNVYTLDAIISGV